MMSWISFFSAGVFSFSVQASDLAKQALSNISHQEVLADFGKFKSERGATGSYSIVLDYTVCLRRGHVLCSRYVEFNNALMGGDPEAVVIAYDSSINNANQVLVEKKFYDAFAPSEIDTLNEHAVKAALVLLERDYKATETVERTPVAHPFAVDVTIVEQFRTKSPHGKAEQLNTTYVIVFFESETSATAEFIQSYSYLVREVTDSHGERAHVVSRLSF